VGATNGGVDVERNRLFAGAVGGPDERSGRRRFLAAALLGVCLPAALLSGACGGDATANANKNQGASKEGADSGQVSYGGLGHLPQGSEPVELDPADFTTRIDNPYWPMAPGDRWVYRETEEKGTTYDVEVTVTEHTKKIANGVEARVVHDVVSQNGQPVEITYDWYAQDEAGNIWYLGEDTAEYENGKVTSRAGSFEAGVDGAQAGIIMPAHPEDGMAYRQEYYEGEAEDRAEVLSTREQVEVPFGHFTGALMTKDLVPTEPKVSEYKLYARNVGPVLDVQTSGGSSREELISYTRGG
jgi:hypothetical protein